MLRATNLRAAILLVLMVSPALAADCKLVGSPQVGGVEPPFAVDATCTDPDYNDKTFVLGHYTAANLQAVRRVDDAVHGGQGHTSPAPGRKPSCLPVSVRAQRPSATAVTWRFPDKAHWRHRFFQQSYPLALEFLNTVDIRFAFTNGGYTVGVTPGSPNVGYRVIAAAAKLARVMQTSFTKIPAASTATCTARAADPCR